MRHTSIGGMRNTLGLQQPATIVEEQKQEAQEQPAGLGFHPDIKKVAKGDDLLKLNSTRKSHVSNEEGQICRICFDENAEKDDPLISPCKCSGSMEYVHLKCLRKWRSRQENKKIAPHVTTYTWKAFHCDICKEKLKDSFQVGKKTYQIFELQKPTNNYMLIESF